jgi:hypothetical protein
VKAVARGAARCALHVHGRGAKTDSCGRSITELSKQLFAIGLRLRQKISEWFTGRFPRRHACT